VLPASESAITADTIELCLRLLGDSLLPFLRASAQMRWQMSSYGGQLIFRENSAFTLLCRWILRLFAHGYAELFTRECRRLLEENGPKIPPGPISDDAAALVFIDRIFEPVVNFLVSSVGKLPTVGRILMRLMLVRAAGFYVEQNAAFLVLPNLLFLRFLVPPLAEETTIAYADDPGMRRTGSLLSAALLSFCNQLGWPVDKEPYLANFTARMERLYPKLDEFTFSLIDCHEWEYDTSALNAKGDLVELLQVAAGRVILMDEKAPNKLLRSHAYLASLIHMIEEYVYDFSGVDTTMES
jgi:hypothetical protein